MSKRKGQNGRKFENEVKAIELKYCPESRHHSRGDRRFFLDKACNKRVEADAVLENFFGEHRDLIVEKKFQEEKNGTTIEKIPYTWYKIEKGVYGVNPYFAIVSVCLAPLDSIRNADFAESTKEYRESGRKNFANVHYFTNLVDYEAFLRSHAQRTYVAVQYSKS